ncbi:hypothetical protein N7449_000240 [Penicillium cf. viridicatum]|uniref:Rhodopsin domain-containing protein n=1 Tax=Penicillium cf. viridicatum TaxID=2972119 RepID=A0A9W9N4J7_9EURO|nr:hypothetical protein N7449_000240 [Penicillium cf. viridicatum]
MNEDPAILALFGPTPSNIDLTASDVSINNGVVIAMLCLATAFVMLRFTARIFLRNALMADDWAIIAALLCIGATTGISVAGGTTGAGKHIWAVKLEELIDLYRLLFSYTFIYASSCTCTRLSILCFYARVFSPLEPALKVTLIFGCLLTLSYPIIIWVTMGNACKPVSHFWTQFSGTEGECINVNQFFLALGILNMLNDFIILIIPFPRIARLQMTLRKKLAVCGIMAVGVFVFVASIVRIHYLSEFMSAADVTWLMGPVFIWSTIEPSVAVSILSSLHSQRSIAISSERLGGPNGGSGRGLQRGNKTNNCEPTFDYGFDQMKRSASDDEIGLTNYVTVGPNEGIHHSNDSVSEDIGHNYSIAVHSSIVQSSSSRPP